MRIDVFKGKMPKCFDSKAQYKDWVEAARAAPPRFGTCTDCTVAYKADMVRQSRCGHPYVEFKKAPDGAIEGVFPLEELRKMRDDYVFKQEREEDFDVFAGEEEATTD